MTPAGRQYFNMTKHPAAAVSGAIAQRSPRSVDSTGPGGAGYPGHDLEAMSVADRYNREIVSAFSPFLGERSIEVGAGIGNISVLLLERELEHLHVVEPDRVMHARISERLRGRTRVTVHRGFLSTVVAQDRVGGADSVVSVNVLEHVEEDIAELTLMRSVLRPGGHLCLWVPALPALYSDFDRALGHYRRYRKAELAAKVREAGFRTLRIEYRDIVGMAAWFLACRVLGLGLSPGKMRIYDRVVVPLTAGIERRLRLPVGKNLLVVARKP